jgi:hypothetical protein
MENFEFLKERAKEFWERGFEDFEKKKRKEKSSLKIT